MLTKVLFKEGQMVKKGQLLATIEPRPFELALMQAQASARATRRSWTPPSVTLERYQTLLQQDSIARQDVDTQAALVKQLQGTVLDRPGQRGHGQAEPRLDAHHRARRRPRRPAHGRRRQPRRRRHATGIAMITELAPIDVEFAIPQDRVPQLQARIAAGAVLAVDGAGPHAHRRCSTPACSCR